MLGRYAHITKFDEAHERFNFLMNSDSNYYGYLPPIGKMERPPQPKVKNGWLLIFVSAKNGNGPLTVVGWYENATLHGDYADRPEYETDEDFETDIHDVKYGYCISASKAHLIPVTDRTQKISGEHFKRSPVLYVRGNEKSESWREEFAILAETLVSDSQGYTETPTPKISFPDPEHRKLVEKAAIDFARNFLRKEYRVIDRQKDNCGYDLLARHRKTGGELHVEVKGTSGNNMHFYMTRGEFRYMPSPRWRLIIVTEALVNPKLRLMSSSDVRKNFDFEAFAWEATSK